MKRCRRRRGARHGDRGMRPFHGCAFLLAAERIATSASDDPPLRMWLPRFGRAARRGGPAPKRVRCTFTRNVRTMPGGRVDRRYDEEARRVPQPRRRRGPFHMNAHDDALFPVRGRREWATLAPGAGQADAQRLHALPGGQAGGRPERRYDDTARRVPQRHRPDEQRVSRETPTTMHSSQSAGRRRATLDRRRRQGRGRAAPVRCSAGKLAVGWTAATTRWRPSPTTAPAGRGALHTNRPTTMSSCRSAARRRRVTFAAGAGEVGAQRLGAPLGGQTSVGWTAAAARRRSGFVQRHQPGVTCVSRET